jgi:hypothetical protein
MIREFDGKHLAAANTSPLVSSVARKHRRTTHVHSCTSSCRGKRGAVAKRAAVTVAGRARGTFPADTIWGIKVAHVHTHGLTTFKSSGQVCMGNVSIKDTVVASMGDTWHRKLQVRKHNWRHA